MRISDWSSDVCSSDLVAERILRIDAGVGEDAVVADAVDLVELGYLPGVLLGPAVIGEPAPGDALHVPAQPAQAGHHPVRADGVATRHDRHRLPQNGQAAPRPGIVQQRPPLGTLPTAAAHGAPAGGVE